MGDLAVSETPLFWGEDEYGEIGSEDTDSGGTVLANGSGIYSMAPKNAKGNLLSYFGHKAYQRVFGPWGRTIFTYGTAE